MTKTAKILHAICLTALLTSQPACECKSQNHCPKPQDKETRKEPMALTQTTLKLADGSDSPVETLSNGTVSISIAPELGGKIISIKDIHGKEYVSRSERPYVKRTFGMPFGDTEFDGIDECFPCMGGCKYPAEPYKDTVVVDHGELVSSVWKKADGEGLSLTCDGVNFPYTFRRDVTLEGNTIVMNYTVTNNGDAPFHYLYLFHPLLAADTGTSLGIPDDMEIGIGPSAGNFLGQMGETKPWGQLQTATGRPFKDNQFVSHSGRYYKYYSDKLEGEGDLTLRHADGTGIRMTWNGDVLPYFAVWTSEGSVGGLHHFAPEPANSSKDTLADAYELGQANVIPPHGTAGWTIRMEVLSPEKSE
jgi:galactose mutarotase-like enzyme